jgi:uncharacterized protein with PIN domain
MAHATECEMCGGELIITPAYPVRDRTVRCGNCGRTPWDGNSLNPWGA